MSTQTHTVNLTPLFIIWTAVFVTLALTQGGSTYWVLASLPWVFLLGFWMVTMVIVLTVLAVKYRQGYPITLTTPRKGTRVVRRTR